MDSAFCTQLSCVFASSQVLIILFIQQQQTYLLYLGLSLSLNSIIDDDHFWGNKLSLFLSLYVIQCITMYTYSHIWKSVPFAIFTF